MFISKRCGPVFTLTLLNPRYWLSWLGLSIGFLVSLLPNRTRHFLGRRVGNLIYKYHSKRHTIVKTNLTISFPQLSDLELEAMTQKHLQWYACALIDYTLFFFASKRRLSQLLEIEGRQHIDEALKNNQSIIIMLAHSVMLEFAPAALGLHYNSYGSYKTSKNPVIDWMIARSRCRHVKFVVSRDEGMRKLVKSLVPNQLLIFLPDEDLGKNNAVFAPFFNKSKATLTTPARLAKLGKARCLPTFAWYDTETNKYKIQIAPPLKNGSNDYPGKDKIENATTLNKALEDLIRQHPEQYMWTMKLFRTRPENEDAIY